MTIENLQPTNATTLQVAQFAEVVNIIQTRRNELLQVANKALLDTYWQVGKYISEKIEQSTWGDNIVSQLAAYIAKTAPELKGFSDKNLWRMKRFYETYVGDEKLSPLVREIGWTQNILIMSRCDNATEREFYIRLTKRDRLTKRELDRQISASVYERTMLGQSKLPPLVRELGDKAKNAFRDQYVMEYITGKEAKPENSLRNALIKHMKEFILELGKDFIYMGEEYRVQVGMSDFRIDLLFFHRELQCLVAFELKTEAFKPEHLGQLNFYLEALDRDVKKPQENPSIGVLLCQDKDDEVVEYALSRSLSPTLVAKYQLCLPDKKLLQKKMREIFNETEGGDK